MGQPGDFHFKKGDTTCHFTMYPPFGAALETGRFHEPFTSATFIELLQPGDVVVDVGANVGYYSLLSNAAMQGTGRIFAFEPNPFVFLTLTRHIAANRAGSAITAFNLALSNSSGTAQLLVDTDHSGLSRVLGAGEDAPASAVTCATMPLDDIVAANGIDRIRLLKIDAEGHERYVIEGARNTLGRRVPDYVVCEINRPELLRNQCSEGTIRKTFEGLGYDVELINASDVDLCGGLARRPYPLPEYVDTNLVFNILFKRR